MSHTVINGDRRNHFVTKYFTETAIDASLDLQLRGLLSRCFPNDAVFEACRHFKYVPKGRVAAYSEGELAGNATGHHFFCDIRGKTEIILGVSEVCVSPECRGKRLMGSMLSVLESELGPECNYSLLIGNPSIYKGSGYYPTDATFNEDVFSKKNNDIPLMKVLQSGRDVPSKVNIQAVPF